MAPHAKRLLTSEGDWRFLFPEKQFPELLRLTEAATSHLRSLKTKTNYHKSQSPHPRHSYSFSTLHTAHSCHPSSRALRRNPEAISASSSFTVMESKQLSSQLSQWSASHSWARPSRSSLTLRGRHPWPAGVWSLLAGRHPGYTPDILSRHSTNELSPAPPHCCRLAMPYSVRNREHLLTTAVVAHSCNLGSSRQDGLTAILS